MLPAQNSNKVNLSLNFMEIAAFNGAADFSPA